MSLAIPEHYRRQFENNWNHVVQQQISRLRGKVTVCNFSGKEKIMTDLDEVEFEKRQGRLTKSNPKEITANKRKITKEEFKCQIILDRKDGDYLEQLGSPDSEIMESMRMAWNRAVDSGIVLAADATVYGGAEPYVTPITLPAGQTVAVDLGGSNEGLTPDKINQMVKILEDQEIYPDEEECYIAIGPQQKLDLIAYVAASPNDVWAQMIAPFIKGESNKLFGLNVVQSNRLSVDGSDIRTVPVWSKRGIYAAPDTMTIKIDELPQQDHAIQIAAYSEYGFARRYEERVGLILCDESP